MRIPLNFAFQYLASVRPGPRYNLVGLMRWGWLLLIRLLLTLLLRGKKMANIESTDRLNNLIVGLSNSRLV